VQTVGEECDEDVCFDTAVFLMVDGADREVSFEVFEGFFYLAQLHVIGDAGCRFVFWFSTSIRQSYDNQHSLPYSRHPGVQIRKDAIPRTISDLLHCRCRFSFTLPFLSFQGHHTGSNQGSTGYLRITCRVLKNDFARCYSPNQVCLLRLFDEGAFGLLPWLSFRLY